LTSLKVSRNSYAAADLSLPVDEHDQLLVSLKERATGAKHIIAPLPEGLRCVLPAGFGVGNGATAVVDQGRQGMLAVAGRFAIRGKRASQVATSGGDLARIDPFAADVAFSGVCCRRWCW